MYVYLITNTKNKKVYVGQTNSSVKERFRQHVTKLNNNIHTNKHLQYSWNKYGKDCFHIEELEECHTQEQLDEREKFYIEQYNSTDRAIGYNKRGGGDGGGNHSKETKILLSEKAKEQWENDREHLEYKRRTQWTPELRKQMSRTIKERWKDPEYIEHQKNIRSSKQYREALKEGIKNSDYDRSKGLRKRWADEDYKKRLSKSIKKALNTPETSEKRKKKLKQVWSDPELLKKHSAIMKKVAQDPEHCEKISKGLSKYFGHVESPDGKVYRVDGIRRFCREHDLAYSSFRSIKYNPNKTYKGWKFLYEDNNRT